MTFPSWRRPHLRLWHCRRLSAAGPPLGPVAREEQPAPARRVQAKAQVPLAATVPDGDETRCVTKGHMLRSQGRRRRWGPRVAWFAMARRQRKDPLCAEQKFSNPVLAFPCGQPLLASGGCLSRRLWRQPEGRPQVCFSPKLCGRFTAVPCGFSAFSFPERAGTKTAHTVVHGSCSQPCFTPTPANETSLHRRKGHRRSPFLSLWSTWGPGFRTQGACA